MHVKNSGHYLHGNATLISIVRRHLRAIVWWPMLALLLTALLWSVVLSKLANDKALLEENAEKQAVSISRAYAQYLTRTIEQLDQLSQQIKYGWEKSDGHLNFDEMSNRGILNIPQFTSITIFDERGRPLSSTLPILKPFAITDREYFQFHKKKPSNELRIGVPTIGRVSGKQVIQVSRRLEKENGVFGGVIVIGVSPEFFTLFTDDPALGQNGILAFIGEDGTERVSRMSHAQSSSSPISWLPLVKSSDAAGAYQFVDGKERFVASQKIDRYSFFALVGLSREDILLPYARNLVLYRRIAIGGTAILFLFSFVAMLMSIRLTWRKYQAEAIRETYRLATEGGNEGFYIMYPNRDENGHINDFQIVDCNERGAMFFGLSREKFIGTKISTFYSGDYFDRLMKTYCSAMETGFYEDDYRVPEGSPIGAEWLKRKFVRSENGLAATVRDISDSKRHERELSRLATEDGLTALPNRYWLMRYLPEALAIARARSTMLAILFIDLDDFKNVNDTMGHSAGDQLLCAVAARLKSVVRSTDKVIRIGGDEFTIILEAIHNEDEVAHIAAAINQALQQPFDLSRDSKSQKNRVGASIGISLFPRDGHDVETLIKNADIAMYAAKADSKGGVRFFDRMLYENIKAKVDTEQELLQAIENDEFTVYYQVRVHTLSGKPRAMEALLRWRHPERGLILPADFIALAEETELIDRIGEIAVDKVCAQLASWRAKGIGTLPVSVNISAHQFHDGKVEKLIASCLEKYQIPSALLEIELTESAMIRNSGDIHEEIAAIHKMGIRVHVDDFGSGYSSLPLLQRLDLSGLKIDQAFTSQLGKDRNSEAFFRAMISMAKALGMDVIAEGVETREQLTILQTLGCDEIQGYYIEQALPADEVVALLVKPSLFP